LLNHHLHSIAHSCRFRNDRCSPCKTGFQVNEIYCGAPLVQYIEKPDSAACGGHLDIHSIQPTFVSFRKHLDCKTTMGTLECACKVQALHAGPAARRVVLLVLNHHKRHIMNAIVSAAILSTRSESEIIEHADGSAEFVISPQLTCHYEKGEATLWSRWAPRGIPSFNSELLHDLERASQMIEGHFSNGENDRPLNYLVIRSGVPGAFNVGGDLGYFQRLIATGDRARLTEYARAAVNVVYRNYVAHELRGVTTIALLEGDALGGGFECALSCDVIIAEKHVKAGFPEVLFNMFPGMGGMSFLSRRVGRKYSALELLELGVIDDVVNTGEGQQAVQNLMRKRQHQTAAHIAMNTVDRMIRPLGMQELHDVVKIWVDCAMQLSPRSLEWMQRLYQRQLAIFGRPLELADAKVADEQTAIAA
jgi:DSF synthase